MSPKLETQRTRRLEWPKYARRVTPPANALTYLVHGWSAGGDMTVGRVHNIQVTPNVSILCDRGIGAAAVQ